VPSCNEERGSQAEIKDNNASKMIASNTLKVLKRSDSYDAL